MLGQPFDPHAETCIYEHCRPHWSQAGTVVFVTFHTDDSIPRHVLSRWQREKLEWLRRRGLEPSKYQVHGTSALPEEQRRAFLREFQRRREAFLDTCQGQCLLRQPVPAQVVADTLRHFDGQRYLLGDFVVMPNHVHLLAVFRSAEELKKQCDSWLHFSARKINQSLGVNGKFWQQEPFDHLVRSARQLEYLRRYIADNPRRAKLSPGEYLFWRYTD